MNVIAAREMKLNLKTRTKLNSFVLIVERKTDVGNGKPGFLVRQLFKQQPHKKYFNS